MLKNILIDWQKNFLFIGVCCFSLSWYSQSDFGRFFCCNLSSLGGLCIFVVMRKGIIIVVDGFFVCGKSMFVKVLVKELDYIYIDIGVMYCVVMFYFLDNQVDWDDI